MCSSGQSGPDWQIGALGSALETGTKKENGFCADVVAIEMVASGFGVKLRVEEMSTNSKVRA